MCLKVITERNKVCMSSASSMSGTETVANLLTSKFLARQRIQDTGLGWISGLECQLQGSFHFKAYFSYIGPWGPSAIMRPVPQFSICNTGMRLTVYRTVTRMIEVMRNHVEYSTIIFFPLFVLLLLVCSISFFPSRNIFLRLASY